jgi:hypothetical protein
VRDYSLQFLAGDNLVSADSRSSSAAMMSSTDGTRTDEPDLTLIENTSRIKAIEEIMHRLLPLAHQAAAIQAQTEQHQLQNGTKVVVDHYRMVVITKMMMMTRRPSPPPVRWNSPSMMARGDPLPWLNRCERYFHARRTPEHRSITYASFYLTDDAQL